MKKALIVTTISGFLQQFEMNDVHILQEYGYDVHYASNFNNPVYSVDKEKLQKEGIILHHIDIEKSPFSFAANVKAIGQLRRIIDDEKVDLVHCHNPMGSVAARIAAKKSSKSPYVMYTAHGFHFYENAPVMNWILYYTAEKFLAKYTDEIITINREDYNRAKTFCLKKNGGVGWIFGVGIDLDKFKRRNEMNLEVREKIGIPNDAFHIVTAAQINKNKNQRVIIEALSTLKRDDIYYTICGEGVYEEKLKKLVHEKKLDRFVKFLGYRNDMENILQSADCFAFPSKREGLGIAAVEALATGVPLIVADNRGTREYGKDGYNCIVCDANNPGMFADAIDRLYKDRAYRDELASHCRNTSQKFSLEMTDRIMRDIYKKADAYVNLKNCTNV